MERFTQGTPSISSYYTQLKALWDEFDQYRSIPSCSCGALKILQCYHQEDQTLQFLMGLDDKYTADRGQILLLEPLPPISKVFSLVLQEEQQRDCTSLNKHSDILFMAIPGILPLNKATIKRKSYMQTLWQTRL